MNGILHSHRIRRSVTVLSLLAITLALAIAGPAQTTLATSNSGVVPPNGSPYGKSYAEWNNAWAQWIMSIPITNPADPEHPWFDNTGAYCGEHQSGPVWFLAGYIFGGGVVRDECVVPANKALFFPVANNFVDTTPPACAGLGTTYTDCLSAVQPFVNSINDMSVELDGQMMYYSDLLPYRSTSPAFFNVHLPQNYNIYDYIAYLTNGGNYRDYKHYQHGGIYQAVADGYYLMLRPLSAGPHTIRFTATDGSGFSLDVTYNLTVR